MKTFGIVLIILGIVALAYTSFTFTSKEKVIDAGPLELSKEKKHTVGWPPFAGALLVVAGVVLVVVGRKR